MVVPAPGEGEGLEKVTTAGEAGVMISPSTATISSNTGESLSSSPKGDKNNSVGGSGLTTGISSSLSDSEKTLPINSSDGGGGESHNNQNTNNPNGNSQGLRRIPGSTMDLEQGDGEIDDGKINSSGVVDEPAGIMNQNENNHRIKKYAFNPDDPDLPPHLSEYFEQNVIAILNRCDPERGRRCYSCGYDNTDKWQRQQNQNQLQQEPGYNSSGYSSGFRNSVGYDDDTYTWNSYGNYHGNNDYNNGTGYSHHHHQQNTGGYNNQHPYPQSQHMNVNYYDAGYSVGQSGLFYNYQHGNMSESEMAISRRRYYSDGSSDPDGSSNAMDDEEVFTFDARLLSEAFLSSGRIDHTIQLMAYHPDYLEIFLKTHHFLMRGDGPLPYNHRNYIAIMAAARYQCSYLMELQKREFLYQGGDPKWLRGLDAAPAKLMALYNINKIMAHRPWVLKKEDFLHLTKKAGWSLSEVVQAVVILAHFHSLSSFIQGCGITPEIDFDKGHLYKSDRMDIRMDPGNFNTFRPMSVGGDGGAEPTDGAETESSNKSDNNSSSPSVSFAMDQPSYFGSTTVSTNSSDLMKGNNKQTKSILKKTEVVSTTTANNSSNNNPSSPSSKNLLKDTIHHNSLGGGASANSPPKKGLGSSVSEVEIIMATMKDLETTSPIEDPEERKKRFENVASSDDSQEKENLLSHNLNKGSSIPPEIIPFVCDPEFIYEDFAKRGQVSELHTFRIQDYSWEEHGFSLVNRLYTEVGVYLDEKFKVTQSMTYYTMGGRAHVDTTKFRTAVWNYIQCLYGIRHDDYDYGEVNQLLERPLKAYIKTVCCYPERITKPDYDNVMREFKHSEKVHVNLMIMEAKIQAELLYALRTIMRFMI